MLDNLKKYNIILASNSPRRKELLAGLDIDFKVKVIKGIDDSYPAETPVADIPLYIAGKKSETYLSVLEDSDLLITADTVVIVDGKVLGKPKNYDDAVSMLKSLRGKTHQVITGVCIMCKSKRRMFSVTTDVTFSNFSDEETDYYVRKYKPYDKAGAYGIQEWIGYIGVTSLEGSYFNVMGLPVQRIYTELKGF